MIPHSLSTLFSLISSIKKYNELTIVKMIHRFTRAKPSEMTSFFENVGLMNVKIRKVIDMVSRACSVCASNKNPGITKRIFLRRVNEDLKK